MSEHINENMILWENFLKGDEAAFSSFYKKNYPILYSYGQALQIEEGQIRDIIQDIFLKIYSSPSIIKNSSTIRSLLLVSLRNAYINHKKKQKKITNLDDADFVFQYSVENSFGDEEEQRQVKAEVDSIMEKLTPRQKEIIYLRFLHQMSYEEISQIMNMSEQAARNLIYRAVERIRKDNKNSYVLFLIILAQIKF